MYLTVTVISPGFFSAQDLRPDSCHPTKPNGVVAGSSERNESSYGNALLSVGPFGLWPNGTVVFKPGGAGFQTQDGALGMKFGWTRGIRGKLNVTGRRIDADAPPLRFETGTPNSESGFIASYLIFPTAGCWEVTAQIGDRVDSKITFVTRVEKIGNGQSWSGQIVRLVVSENDSAVTTAKWNHGEERLKLRFARGDKANPLPGEDHSQS